MNRALVKIFTSILVPILLTGCTGTQGSQQNITTSEHGTAAISAAASTVTGTKPSPAKVVPSTAPIAIPSAAPKATTEAPAPAALPVVTASPVQSGSPVPSPAPAPESTVSSTVSASASTAAPTASSSSATSSLVPSPAASPTVAANPIESPESYTYPLQISSNKRYFVDQMGSPYFIFADTGWMLFSNITLQEADYYLEYRHNQNVNSILCYAAPFFIDATNKQGEPAFLNNKLSTPNDKYFKHVDQVIELAAEKGMQVIMCPVEMCNYAAYYTVDNARVLGRYMGNRYKDFDNILWFTGGDIHPSKEQIEITNSLAAGIRDYDKRHMISFHPAGGNSSSDYFSSQPWLDYNMVQVHAPDSPKAYQLLLSDCFRIPAKPSILIETCYEDMIKGNPVIPNTPYQIRRSIAWGFLSGGCGMSYGNQILYKFITDSQNDWKNTLGHPAFQQTADMAGFFMKRAWQKLVPDKNHTLLTDGYYADGSLEYSTAALAEDGSFAVIYLPTPREITIDMSRFNGSKQIKWYDPTSNTLTPVVNHPSKGSRIIAPRPKNSAGEYDWFLVIE